MAGDTRRVGRRTRQLLARAETTNQVRISRRGASYVTADTVISSTRRERALRVQDARS